MADPVIEDKVVETAEEVILKRFEKEYAKKLADKEKEYEVKYAEKVRQEVSRLESELIKQVEDTVIETSSNKEEVREDSKTQDNVEAFAEKIKAKRQKERLDKEEEDRLRKYQDTENELKQYKMREQLEQIKKEEPYLADVIDDAVKDGTLTSVEQLNVIFNDSLRTRLKTAYLYEEAITQAGGDPRTYLQNKGSGIDSIAKEELRKQKLAEKKAKYRRNY